jgi:hypothetical protein
MRSMGSWFSGGLQAFEILHRFELINGGLTRCSNMTRAHVLASLTCLASSFKSEHTMTIFCFYETGYTLIKLGKVCD